MALEAFHWYAQRLYFSDSHFVMLKWPLFHWLSPRESATVPIPLCHFCSFFDRNLPPDFMPLWTVVNPVLFCAFLQLAGLTLTYIRLANIEQSPLRPTTFQEDLSGHITMLFTVQSPFAFFRKRARAGSSHAHSFNSSYPCFAAPLLPIH